MCGNIHSPMLNLENANFDEDGMTVSVEVMEINGYTISLSAAIKIGRAPRRRFSAMATSRGGAHAFQIIAGSRLQMAISINESDTPKS